MDELLDKYKEKFRECFPLMLTMGKDEKQIEDIIKDCLKKNKPYEVDSDGDY